MSNSPIPSPISDSEEWRRICAVPRRRHTREWVDKLVDSLTSYLRQPHGTMRLRPVQAMALAEIATCGGLLGPIKVGDGKTLIALLAPVITQSTRPLLLIPAALGEKTRLDRLEYSAHFRVPKHLHIVTYEALGRTEAAHKLWQYQPDHIIADEGHKLRNRRSAAVARRIDRYMSEQPGCRFTVMSGTLIDRSLRDYAHLCKWSLRANSPLPAHEGELEEWCEALDETVSDEKRRHPGVLTQWSGGSDVLLDVRKGYRDRLLDTPGVITSPQELSSRRVIVSLYTPPLAPVAEQHFRRLRKDWQTPDEWPLAEAMEQARHARSLSLGFYYRWNPRPPVEWLEPRKAWYKACREILSHSRKLDSVGQIKDAVQRGRMDELAPLLDDWLQVEPTFKPQTEAVWYDHSVLAWIAEWCKGPPGIIWTRHKSFALALAHGLGLEYYGAEGIEHRSHIAIEHATGARTIVASVAANSVGRNLQRFNRNLIVDVSGQGRAMEQLLGRTDRPGQKFDVITVDILISCGEHLDAMDQMMRDANYVHTSTGASQILLKAEITDRTVRSFNDIHRWKLYA